MKDFTRTAHAWLADHSFVTTQKRVDDLAAALADAFCKGVTANVEALEKRNANLAGEFVGLVDALETARNDLEEAERQRDVARIELARLRAERSEPRIKTLESMTAVRA